MTGKRDEIKRRHEKAVAEQLVAALDPGAEFIAMGNDRDEPDVIYAHAGVRVGIEVGTGYYDESDARQLWTDVAGEREFPDEGVEPRWGGVIREPSALIQQRVAELVRKKWEKRYRGVDEAWLAIDCIAPLMDDDDFSRCCSSIPRLIRMLPSGPFTRVYLVATTAMSSAGSRRGYRFALLWRAP